MGKLPLPFMPSPRWEEIDIFLFKKSSEVTPWHDPNANPWLHILFQTKNQRESNYYKNYPDQVKRQVFSYR